MMPSLDQPSSKNSMTQDPLRKALRDTLQGLTGLCGLDDGLPIEDRTSTLNLSWMAKHALDNMNEWPVDKTSRWIGFIQGCLACKGFLDVDDERERTRPLFHTAYVEMGIDIPATASSTDR